MWEKDGENNRRGGETIESADQADSKSKDYLIW